MSKRRGKKDSLGGQIIFARMPPLKGKKEEEEKKEEETSKTFDERDTMRYALKHLVEELGEEEGKKMFEWYCETYSVGIGDMMPPVVRWEVFGTDKTFEQLRQEHADKDIGKRGRVHLKINAQTLLMQKLLNKYKNGESVNWVTAQKIAEEVRRGDEKIDSTTIMQACEAVVVQMMRGYRHMSLREGFDAALDLYDRQVIIRPTDTKSKVLQQYSTPCPLAYLLGRYVTKDDDFKSTSEYLEPTAGNGMLTAALPTRRTVVNEIDTIRHANLKMLADWREIRNEDARTADFGRKRYIGVITNPPFGNSEPFERRGWKMRSLDYELAIKALDCMADNGRAAIIVGGKMWNGYWQPRGGNRVLFGEWKMFLGYLHAQYKVEDVIYMSGEQIYRKQGTTFPIVAILINGRREYSESHKPRYIYDKDRDGIVETYEQLYDRMAKWITSVEGKREEKREEKRKKDEKEEKGRRLRLLRVKARAAMAKMIMRGGQV